MKGNELYADLTTKEGRAKIAEALNSHDWYTKGEFLNILVQKGSLTIEQAIEMCGLQPQLPEPTTK